MSCIPSRDCGARCLSEIFVTMVWHSCCRFECDDCDSFSDHKGRTGCRYFCYFDYFNAGVLSRDGIKAKVNADKDQGKLTSMTLYPSVYGYRAKIYVYIFVKSKVKKVYWLIWRYIILDLINNNVIIYIINAGGPTGAPCIVYTDTNDEITPI